MSCDKKIIAYGKMRLGLVMVEVQIGPVPTCLDWGRLFMYLFIFIFFL